MRADKSVFVIGILGFLLTTLLVLLSRVDGDAEYIKEMVTKVICESGMTVVDSADMCMMDLDYDVIITANIISAEGPYESWDSEESIAGSSSADYIENQDGNDTINGMDGGAVVTLAAIPDNVGGWVNGVVVATVTSSTIMAVENNAALWMLTNLNLKYRQ